MFVGALSLFLATTIDLAAASTCSSQGITGLGQCGDACPGDGWQGQCCPLRCSCQSGGGCDDSGAPAPPAPPAPPPPSSFPVAEVLRKHNIYRCMHGVPLLTWNNQIAQQAQQWSDHQRGVMEHGGMDGYSGGHLGQNLAGLLPQYGYNEVRGVKMWYDEIQHTNGGQVGSFGMNTGHYTQVVWRGTREVGCGEWVQGTCNNNGNPCLLTCDYFPAGNMDGEFAQNVNGPTKSEAQCESEVPQVLYASGGPHQDSHYTTGMRIAVGVTSFVVGVAVTLGGIKMFGRKKVALADLDGA